MSEEETTTQKQINWPTVAYNLTEWLGVFAMCVLAGHCAGCL